MSNNRLYKFMKLEQFLKSELDSFDEFLETLISTDISKDNIPEQPVDDEEQEEGCTKKNKKKSK